MLQSLRLSKKYDKKIILDEVTLTIPSKQVTAFIGANGAGKSTLLGIMSRLISKEDGSVLIDDRDVTQWKSRALAQKLAILKQSNQVSARLSVADLVAFGRFPYSQGRLTTTDQQKIDQAMAYMEITNLKDRYLDELSGGQQQRVYIAMIIAQDTEYVLLDEPLNNLDMKHAVQMMKILRRLVDDFGKTIVIVLHDINFASAYADYMVGLKDGKVVAQGDTASMMTTEMLNLVYDMPLAITEVNSCKYCLYFK